MVKYKPVLEKLREQHVSDDASDSIPDWLDTLCDGPSLSENIAPVGSPPCTSASSPPATPPHLRTRRGRPPRKPLQTSKGNQGPAPRSSLKRKLNNHDSDAEEQLPRDLRDKATLRKPAKYRDEQEQVLHGQTSPVRGSGSPQKQQARGGRGGATSGQGHTIGSGQLAAGPRLVPNDISPGNPIMLFKGQGGSSSSPGRRPQSSSKSSHTSDRKIYMARLKPGVCFRNPRECLYDRKVMPSVVKFWLNYIRSDDSNCYIPRYFEEEIIRQASTPNKTKNHVSTEYFTDVRDGWYGNFYESELEFLFKEVCDVIRMTEKYCYNAGCTKAHWTAVVVHPLLRIVRRLAKYKRVDGFENLEVADMTTVDLNTRHAPKDRDNESKSLNKKIDAALGLSLTSIEEDFLRRAEYKDAVPLINPILSEYGPLNPFFMHFKVKLQYTDRMPGPQLGIWAAAEFSKRELEGYSLDMPIVSISIVRDVWELYVAYPKGSGEDVAEDDDEYGHCMLMGPVSIGNTSGIQGVFEILHYLCKCADWGVQEYRGWFEREILRKYGWVPEEEKAKGKGKKKA